MSEADNRMEELADRVERASGADRELDCKIARAVGKVPVGAAYEGTAKIGDVAWHNGLGYKIPAFTAELDAAMSLVPEGHGWCLYYDGSCSVGPIPDPGCIMEDRFIGEGETPALGLAAASLRARALTDARP